MKPATTIALAAFCSAAHSGVVYDESVSGDLGSGDYVRLPAFELAYGTNDFRGSAFYSNVDGPAADWDSVRFTLPGPALVTITYSSSASALPDTSLLRAGLDLLPTPFPSIPARPCDQFGCLGVNLLSSAPQTILDGFATDWRTWYFPMVWLQALGAPGQGGGGTWTYDARIDVAPMVQLVRTVPEPSSLALALGALLLIRRRAR